MKRSSAEEPFFRKPTQFEHLKGEEIIMADCYFETATFRQIDQRSRVIRRNREGLFQIDMGARLKALFGKRKMPLRRGCNRNNVGVRCLEHLPEIGKTFGNPKSLAELLCHQQFLITQSYNLAARYPAYGLDVLV